MKTKILNQPMPGSLIIPDWPAPATVRAVSTTRLGGVSRGAYDSFNLGLHVGDDPAAVQANRQRLRESLQLAADPAWLNQVHQTRVVNLSQEQGTRPEADASLSRAAGRVCAVMTADCLPVLFCSRDGTVVAAAHAGWRGLVNGVLETTVSAMHSEPGQILAWLGPAIGPQAYEVGDEVRQAFVDRNPDASRAFTPSPYHADGQHWLADLYQLARLSLTRAGVTAVSGGGECTYHDARRFYSYRRDGVTGRMASLVWISA